MKSREADTATLEKEARENAWKGLIALQHSTFFKEADTNVEEASPGILEAAMKEKNNESQSGGVSPTKDKLKKSFKDVKRIGSCSRNGPRIACCCLSQNRGWKWKAFERQALGFVPSAVGPMDAFAAIGLSWFVIGFKRNSAPWKLKFGRQHQSRFTEAVMQKRIKQKLSGEKKRKKTFFC